jgi:hypothetical protein
MYQHLQPSSYMVYLLPIGTVSINVDAAIFASSRQMGSGVVIRDHNGVCLTACSEQFDEFVTPGITEALAMSA